MKSLFLFCLSFFSVLGGVVSQQWDITIPPIESRPVAPSARSLVEGNWGNQWAGTTEFYQEIYDRAQRPVVCFILDTAPLLSHPDLEGFAWNDYGKSWTGEETFEDGHGHGHHVAGIMGASNSRLPLGVASALVDKDLFKGVPFEVLNDNGSGSYSWIIGGLEDVINLAPQFINNGWFVMVNMSLGGPNDYGPLEDALRRVEEAGVLTVVAAGNDYKEEISYPGRSKHVKAVGSLDQDGSRSSYSNYGEQLFISFPGRSILSTWLNDELATLSGTSMATPGIAAMGAIIASIYPTLDAAGVAEALKKTCTDIGDDGWDKETGWGYPHARAILNYNAPSPEPEPEPDIITRRAHIIEGVFEGPFEFMYQPGQGTFITTSIRDIHIEFKTKDLSPKALEDMRQKIDAFFVNRAITIRHKEDDLDAGYWAAQFLKRYLKKEHKISSDVNYVEAIDNQGNIGYPNCPCFFDFLKSPKRATFRF